MKSDEWCCHPVKFATSQHCVKEERPTSVCSLCNWYKPIVTGEKLLELWDLDQVTFEKIANDISMALITAKKHIKEKES